MHPKAVLERSLSACMYSPCERLDGLPIDTLAADFRGRGHRGMDFGRYAQDKLARDALFLLSTYDWYTRWRNASSV